MQYNSHYVYCEPNVLLTRYLISCHWQPISMNMFLILKRPFLKRLGHVTDSETANGASTDGIFRRGEDSIHHVVIDYLTRRLDLIEVKWNVSGH